ncbi:MAG: SRPBCC family protein [Planctomycetota bacterium]
MRAFHFNASQRIGRPLADVFAFFADVRNLEAVTPPWLCFKLSGASDDALHEGAEIEARLRLRGVPMRWRSRITCWCPPHKFVDEQVRGPYRKWHHLHTFDTLPDGATMVVDYVEYAVPGGSLFERLVERLFVRPDLERIFAWRRRRIAELLGA